MCIVPKTESHFGLNFIATGEQTDGRYFQCSTSIPPGDNGPPEHKHANESEGFYVISGLLNLYVGGEVHVLEPGDYVNVMPGEVHTWSNTTKKSTELVITFAPSGIENMFRELDEPDSNFIAVGKKYGMTVIT